MSDNSAYKSEEFQVPCQPSGRPSVHCSIRPDDVSSRLDDVIIPSGRYTVSRRFYPACIRLDVSIARPDVSQYSISFWFLSKFQKREDQSTVRTMWYPVRTHVSLRQESYFKYHRPDVWQLWSGRAFIKEGNCLFDFNRPDDCLSWSRRAHCKYGNFVLKNSLRSLIPHGPDARKPYKEITYSRRATVRTMCHPVRTNLLNRKDFPGKFFEKSCRTVVRPNGPCPPSGRRPGIFFLTLIWAPSL
jgi:hypothetical protein